jgi:hypothetical protein
MKARITLALLILAMLVVALMVPSKAPRCAVVGSVVKLAGC